MMSKRCSFSYICELNWGDLEKINESATIDDVYFDEVRYCKNCTKNVYKVDTLSQYNTIINKNLCVAIHHLENLEDELSEIGKTYGKPTLGLPGNPIK